MEYVSYWSGMFRLADQSLRCSWTRYSVYIPYQFLDKIFHIYPPYQFLYKIFSIYPLYQFLDKIFSIYTVLVPVQDISIFIVLVPVQDIYIIRVHRQQKIPVQDVPWVHWHKGSICESNSPGFYYFCVYSSSCNCRFFGVLLSSFLSQSFPCFSQPCLGGCR